MNNEPRVQPPLLYLGSLSPFPKYVLGLGWDKGYNEDMSVEILIYFYIKGGATDSLIPFSLLRLVLSYKGSLELLVRNHESKCERLPVKSKAEWRQASCQCLSLPRAVWSRRLLPAAFWCGEGTA